MGISISDPVSTVIGGALDLGTSLINRLFPDPAQKAEATLKLLELKQNGELAEMTARAGIVQTEAASSNWLTSAWRPITMLSFVSIIVNNYIIYPYLSCFWHGAPLLPIPVDLWELLKIGIGGYVVGRTVEKTAESLAAKKGD
jgi:hypothetical protein